jgi:hypothetical protein
MISPAFLAGKDVSAMALSAWEKKTWIQVLELGRAPPAISQPKKKR